MYLWCWVPTAPAWLWPAAPVFGEAGLAAIGVTCTNPNITAGNDYYFRICFLDPFQGPGAGEFRTKTSSAQEGLLPG